MKRILIWSGWATYWFVFILALIVSAAFFLGAVNNAMAHSWYTGTNDPVYNSSCCGGHDCAPVDPAWVTPVPEGYHLVMTLEQARTVNPLAQQPVDSVIPWSRVQSPPHGHAGESQYHACIYDSDRNAPRHGVICFFATPTM